MTVTAKQMANLRPITKGSLPREELLRRAQNGTKKSIEVRRAAKTFKETIKIALEQEIKRKDGSRITNREGLVLAQIKSGLKGSTFAFAALRDSIGEKPIDKSIELDVSQLSDADLKQLLPEAIEIINQNNQGETNEGTKDTGAAKK